MKIIVTKESLTISAKLKLNHTDEQRQQLLTTCDAYREASNHASQYAFDHLNKSANYRKLNDAIYEHLRAAYGLKSQMAQSAMRRVASTYQGLWTKAKQNAEHKKKGYTKKVYHGLDRALKFTSRTMEQVYGRDFSVGKEQTVSVNTLNGRIRIQYAGWDKHVAMIRGGEWSVGTAKLWYDRSRKQFYLIVPLTKEIDVKDDFVQIKGVDVGQRFLAVETDTENRVRFYRGGPVVHRKRKYQRKRSELQAKGTRSATRRLISLSKRERLFVADVNHKIAKGIASKNTLVGIENLTHIRKRIRTYRKNKEKRRHAEQWSFAEIHGMLTYKSLWNGGYTLRVDPHYTSQACPRCGKTCKENRPNKGLTFRCVQCGYTLHADLVGARNVTTRTLIARQDWAIKGCLSSNPDVTPVDPGANPGEGSHKLRLQTAEPLSRSS